MSGNRQRGAWAIVRWPALIAAVTLAGLIAALLGDGPADAASWLLLGSLPVVIARACTR